MRNIRNRDVDSDRRLEPANASAIDSGVIAAGPHQIEEDVQRELLGHPNLRFSSLVVRRIRDGVCLEGVLNVDETCPDVCGLARQVAGVREVLNHLVIHRSADDVSPSKG
jgi:osmotically-inducible protein OsmY